MRLLIKDWVVIKKTGGLRGIVAHEMVLDYKVGCNVESRAPKLGSL